MSEHEASPGISSASLHRRVRVCRWLWRVLRFVWGTFIIGIIIATIANLNTTTTETPLAKIYIVHLVQTYPIPVWLGLALLAAFTLLSWLGSRDQRVTPAPLLSQQDRIYMLRRLHVRYEQILAQSLQGAVQLELGLAERPDAVQNAVGLVLRLPAQHERPLPENTSIVQAFELAQQELLILGEPGAGKSTLLTELARALVTEAEQDGSRPLPILLPLASWAENKRPLEEWLAKEIARLYDVPSRLSQKWIAAEQVFPLLDGLDEMENTARPACIAAINTYHREHLHPLVVCSRTSEYDAAVRHERLTLHTAVVVQPLGRRQVDTYLASLGRPLAGLRAALKANPLLQELATTPLMLQILMLTYHGTPVRALSQQEAQLREQIWIDYIRRMVEQKGDAKHYPLTATTRWLGWLASEMRRHHQAIFSLEILQPDWLPMRQRNWYIGSAGLGIGLIGALIGGLGTGLMGILIRGLGTELISWLVIGLLAGLSFGLPLGLILARDTRIEPVETLAGLWKEVRSLLPRLLIFSLIFGLITGLASLSAGLVAGLVGGVSFGLAVVLLYGMLLPILGLSRTPLPGDHSILGAS